jgi:hypothetical protein
MQWFQRFHLHWNLIEIIETQEEIMAKIDDLNVAVSQLQATAELVIAKINELKAAGNVDPQIEAATAAVNEAVGKLNAAIQ